MNNILDNSQISTTNNELDISDNNEWDIFDSFVDINTVSKDNIKNRCCINCNSDELIINISNGYMVCTQCGVVDEELLDRNPEWSNYDDGKGESISRYGCQTNYYLPQSSLGTKIGSNNFSRLSLIQNKWGRMIYKERSLLEVLTLIDTMCKSSNIIKAVSDNAKNLFKKLNDSKHLYGINKGKNIIIRGLNRISLISACIFHGAELQGVPRSQKEIAEICGLNVTLVTKGCRKFRELMRDDSILLCIQSTRSVDFVERFAKKLKIQEEYVDIAKTIANNINKLDIASDHQPPSVATGSILLVSELYRLNLNTKTISSRFSISDVTIKKTFKKIYPWRKILVSNENTDKALKILNKNKKQIQKTFLSTNNNFNILNNSFDNQTNDSDLSSEKSIVVEKVKIEERSNTINKTNTVLNEFSKKVVLNDYDRISRYIKK